MHGHISCISDMDEYLDGDLDWPISCACDNMVIILYWALTRSLIIK